MPPRARTEGREVAWELSEPAVAVRWGVPYRGPGGEPMGTLIAGAHWPRGRGAAARHTDCAGPRYSAPQRPPPPGILALHLLTRARAPARTSAAGPASQPKLCRSAHLRTPPFVCTHCCHSPRLDPALCPRRGWGPRGPSRSTTEGQTAAQKVKGTSAAFRQRLRRTPGALAPHVLLTLYLLPPYC